MSLEEALAQHTLALNENTNVLRALMDRLQAGEMPAAAPAKKRKSSAATAVEPEANVSSSSVPSAPSDGGSTPTQPEAPKAEAPAATQPAAETAPTEAAAPAPAAASPSKVDIKSLKEALNAVCKMDGHANRAIGIGKKYGAAKVSEIPEEHYAAVIADCNELLANPEKAAA